MLAVVGPRALRRGRRLHSRWRLHGELGDMPIPRFYRSLGGKMNFLAVAIASLSVLASSSAHADPTRMREDVRGVAPALEKYRDNTLLGGVWKRPGLSMRDRSIVTLAALIARNQTAEIGR